MEDLKGRRFKVVELTRYDEKQGIKEGDEGMILENSNIAPYVRMDRFNEKLHDSDGRCEDGHGKAMYLPQIELLLE